MARSVLALFTEISNKGGIQVFNKYFLEGMTDSLFGRDLKVIVLDKSDHPDINTKNTQIGKISFFRCYSRYKTVKKIKFIALLLFNVIFHKPDYIISNHIQLLRPVILLRPLLKLKFGTVVYGTDVWSLNYTDRMIMEHAEAIASISKYTVRRIESEVKIKNEIYMLPPPIDQNKFYIKARRNDLVRKYGLEGKRIILTVGRFSAKEKEKGHDRIIRALPKIAARIPNVKYLIVGEGDDRPRLSRLAGDLNLGDKVVFCGFVEEEELIDYYSVCDVFVMPSKQEGFGIVYLEAVACGKPVVAGNRDGSVDAVLDGELGTLVDPDNLDEIASGVIKVLEGKIPEKLQDENALRKKAIEAYGIEKFKERTKYFLKLVDERCGTQPKERVP